MQARVSNQQVVLVTTALVVILAGAAGLNAKLVLDGYRSHAVNVQLRVAQYKWLTRDVRGATTALWRTTSLALEAGWRWQVAQSYFWLARGHEQLGDRLREAALCQAGLAALGFGRYDHTRNGTSTTVRKCDELRP
jgi:hypothetical protein